MKHFIQTPAQFNAALTPTQRAFWATVDSMKETSRPAARPWRGLRWDERRWGK